MIKAILGRLRQGQRTTRYPDAPPPPLSERFRGRPVVNASDKQARVACAVACPTGAMDQHGIDLGRCIFCGQCAREGGVSFSNDHRLATRCREDLLVAPGHEYRLAGPLEGSIRRLLGRSLRLRQVSAGGCNACEADANVLTTIGWDIGRFGIQFVASPRHADGLLVTGPVTRNMELALRKTYEAVAEPKIVIACGTCAISGGIYAGHDQTCGGMCDLLPVDLLVPGCPPHPLTLLDGLLRLLGRIR